MTTNEMAPSATLVPERRWPMAVAVLAAIVLQVITPHTGRLAFWWVFPILESAALAAVIAPRSRAHRSADACRPPCDARADRAADVGTLVGLVVLTLDIVDKCYATSGRTRCWVVGPRCG